VRTFASVGQGFRAPNLNEQYSPGFGGLFAGNPELDPERSHSIELGADWELGAHQLGARAYRTRVRDLIAFEGGSTFRAINVARAALDGIELRWDWRTDVWRVDASATLQDARDEATDLDLLRRPQRKFALGIEREFGALIGGAQVQQVSSRRDFAADLASYALLDLRLDYPLSDAWRIGARLDNATDRDYELAAGFATPRRAVLLTLRYEAP
jgi:vitamin B12 transporter